MPLNPTRRTRTNYIAIFSDAVATAVIMSLTYFGRLIGSHRTTASLPAQPARARMIGISLALTVSAVTYTGMAHADEGLTSCGEVAPPMVLAKRPPAAISYAPHHSSLHRHRVPALVRKPAPLVGCTPESLSATEAPLVAPAVADAPNPVVAEAIPPAATQTPPVEGAAAPVVAEMIPPAAMETPSAAAAAVPVAAAVIPPVSTATPQGAIAAAAVGGLPAAAIPIGALITYLGVCVVGHACGGDAGTVGGIAASTTGTTGTH